MDTLRRRVPFRFSQPSEGESDNVILDEQEQSEIIERLRTETLASNRQALTLIQIVVLLSSLIHLVYVFTTSQASPIAVLGPTTSLEDPPLPLSLPFTLLGLALHFNLLLILHPDFLTITLRGSPLRPLSYALSYTLSAIAPTLCFVFGRSWTTTAWWCVTATMIFAVQTMQTSIDRGAESLTELEKMKYTAPGA